MPNPDDPSEEARRRLDDKLAAFEAERAPKAGFMANHSSGGGYRFLGELIGGILAGLGLGAVLDHFAHTTPFGLVGGLLIGTGFSTWLAVSGARRAAQAASEKAGPLPSVPDDEDD